MAGATRLLALAGDPSGATVIIATTPAVAVAGEAIPNGNTPVVFPRVGSVTETLPVPGAATSVAGTMAASPVVDPNCVGNELPFH